MTEAADFLATVARAQMRSGAGDWAEAAELYTPPTFEAFSRNQATWTSRACTARSTVSSLSVLSSSG
jgi:hypothetical protein